MFDAENRMFLNKMVVPYAVALAIASLLGILAELIFSIGNAPLQANLITGIGENIGKVTLNLPGVVAIFLANLGVLFAGRATASMSKVRWWLCYVTNRFLLCAMAIPTGLILGFFLFHHSKSQEQLLLALAIYGALILGGTYLFVLWVSLKGRITTREPLMRVLSGMSCLVCGLIFYVSYCR